MIEGEGAAPPAKMNAATRHQNTCKCSQQHSDTTPNTVFVNASHSSMPVAGYFERLAILLTISVAALYLTGHILAAVIGWRAALGLLITCCWVLLITTYGGSK